MNPPPANAFRIRALGFRPWHLLLALPLILAACGGGSSHSSSTRTGSAVFTVKWPARSRLIPVASNSIKVAIKAGAPPLATQVIVRPNDSATFATLPVGALTAEASAYPTPDGTGTAQAVGTVPLTITADQQTVVNLTMATTIKRVDVASAALTVTRGRTRALTATAYDAVTGGSVVLVSPGTLQWSSNNTAAVRVDPSGVATGVLPGVATITALEKESNVSGTATLTTTPQAIYVTNSLYGRVFSLDDMTASGRRDIPGSVVTFSFPQSIVVDGQNRIYVVDSFNSRIVRVDDMDGTNLVTYGGLSSPRGLAFDSLGRIYVTEFSNKITRIDDMSGTGKVSFTDSSINGPIALAVDSRGRIYIASEGNGTVVRIDDMTGANLVTLSGFSDLRDVKVDRQDRVYTADSGPGKIDRWDNFPSGPASATFTEGIGALLIGLAFDSQGRIYFSDYQLFKLVRIDDLTGAGRVEHTFGSDLPTYLAVVD